MSSNLTRRKFFTWSLLSVPLLSFGQAFASKSCPQANPKDAKALKKLLTPTNRAVKRLKFVFNATDSKHKKYKKGMNCGNCKFFNLKREVENYAPCAMVGNKYVPSCGWCKSYRPRKKKA